MRNFGVVGHVFHGKVRRIQFEQPFCHAAELLAGDVPARYQRFPPSSRVSKASIKTRPGP